LRRSSPLATGCFLGLLVLIVVLGKAGQKWQDFIRGDRDAHRPDSTLIANFQTHRQDLERLVEMARQEQPRQAGGGVVIDMGWTDVKDLSQARWGNYKRLFRKVGAKHGIRGSNDRWEIIMSARGMVTAGSTKGFLYSPSPPTPLIPSLDDPPRAPEGALYRHLDGPWYLYYEWGG